MRTTLFQDVGRACLGFLSFISLSGTVSPVFANHVDINNIQPGELVLVVENGTGVWDVNYTGVTSPQSFDVTQMDSTTWHWTLGGTVGGDADPVVTNNFTLTNTTSSTQTYTVTQLIGVSPAISPASLTSGSIAGSITDNDNNGATLMTVGGTDLYTALIDGSAFTTLLADPFSVSALAG
ncbi:MAG TPA: hypothetical protein VET88_00650, partial [Gammaproteobacteria bacterium]|nr:hypothetical protein [Gammaproteobacteria bacterium]